MLILEPQSNLCLVSLFERKRESQTIIRMDVGARCTRALVIVSAQFLIRSRPPPVPPTEIGITGEISRATERVSGPHNTMRIISRSKDLAEDRL